MKETISGYELKLTCIGSSSWQLFIKKLDNSSDFVRIVYGVTEQKGGGTRKFGIVRNYIISTTNIDDPVFMHQFEESLMKNRRVWVAFETVQRNKGKRGNGVGAYIALSPMQSKWRTSIGSETKFDTKTLDVMNFKQLYSGDYRLGHGFIAQLNAE